MLFNAFCLCYISCTIIFKRVELPLYKNKTNLHILFPSLKFVKLTSCSLFDCLPPAGVKENSIDGLVFDTLIPKPIIQRYLNLLMEHRRIILSGPSGTGKSFLASKLAEYIVTQLGMEVSETTVASFNVDQKSSKVRGK